MIDWLLAFVLDAGYVGIFISMCLVFSFFPFPSQVVLIPAGYLASQGQMSLFLALFSGALGGVVGAHINYYLANRLGRGVILKYGKYILINENALKKSEQFFDNHGTFSIAIGLITPGIGQLISLPAGLAAMHRVKFFFSVVFGSITWNLAMIMLGYFFGGNQTFIEENWGKLMLSILATVALIVAIYIGVKKRSRENSSA